MINKCSLAIPTFGVIFVIVFVMNRRSLCNGCNAFTQKEVTGLRNTM